jgi:ribulose-5-phosphate 4-epimerase/fuculose-1-phosphate aldolase
MEIETELREKTATMCRMLGRQGLIGMFGHVSVRIPGTDRLLLSPGAGADKRTVQPEHLFVFDIDGTLLDHPGPPLKIPVEWRIHTRIHRDRPDALSVAHLHAHQATVLGIAGRPLVPVFSHGAFLRDGVPVWDNPRMVMTDDQAVQLSQTLGDKIAVQMRGHGVCVVGESAEAAFFACTFLEENACKQYEAEVLGEVRALSQDEARDCAAGNFQKALFDLLWDYHEREDAAAARAATARRNP